ncbi:hypothetical protein VP01_4767g2 [Puccinia sorghi]|uniref:Uncharacterized protein n=1 Tax=Puccinia sorghi TaxID=27349 RepID=A0A0L6UPP9_9BASI|nr:hypothetical protein VP01_4767g2 [Puccinia sorghi]
MSGLVDPHMFRAYHRSSDFLHPAINLAGSRTPEPIFLSLEPIINNIGLPQCCLSEGKKSKKRGFLSTHFPIQFRDHLFPIVFSFFLLIPFSFRKQFNSSTLSKSCLSTSGSNPSTQLLNTNSTSKTRLRQLFSINPTHLSISFLIGEKTTDIDSTSIKLNPFSSYYCNLIHPSSYLDSDYFLMFDLSFFYLIYFFSSSNLFLHSVWFGFLSQQFIGYSRRERNLFFFWKIRRSLYNNNIGKILVTMIVIFCIRGNLSVYGKSKRIKSQNLSGYGKREKFIIIPIWQSNERGCLSRESVRGDSFLSDDELKRENMSRHLDMSRRMINNH